jgi:hypothetical protein
MVKAAARFDFDRALCQARRAMPAPLRVAISTAAILSIALSCLSACGNAAAICARAGGSLEGGTCTRSGPQDAANKQWCEEHGAVYLAGSGTCAYGEGR